MGHPDAIHDDTIEVSAVRTDGGTQPRAALYQNVIDDYAESLKAGASFPPVVIFYDGSDYWLADGFHRLRAHVVAGVNRIAADIRQGTRRDAVLHSVGANASHGLRRTNEDKRRAVMTLLEDAEWAVWSDREIARRAGVSNNFASDLRKSLSFNDSEPRTYTTKHGTVATMSTANIGKPSAPPVVMPSSEPVHSYPASEPEAGNDNEVHNHRAQGTGENEWYTPDQHIALARSVMGAIDVDPASSDIANRTVGASEFYTEAQNGLNKPWMGRVWCNPPYAQPAISHFADKMISEVAEGNVTEAIMLTHNYTDTAWFQKLARAATSICFTRGRVRFESPTGEKAAPTQGQAFFYFGKNPEGFCETFREIGFVVEVK